MRGVGSNKFLKTLVDFYIRNLAMKNYLNIPLSLKVY